MNEQDTDQNFVAQALPAFISEAREQIDTFEQLLLQLEDTPAERDLLDALFRCAHTIKGSAGMFGLDRVVAFTHHVESVLDRLREAELDLTPGLSTLLLQCNDHIQTLVTDAEHPGRLQADSQATGEALVERLAQFHPIAGTSAGDPPASADPATPAAAGRWHLRATFGAQTFRNGMDPLAILNYLGTLGRVSDVVCDVDAVPALEGIDPETCHLAFGLALDTPAGREQIESAFSFVRDDCEVELSAPQDGVAPAAPAPQATATAAADAAATSDGPATARAKSRPGGHGANEDHRFIRVQADRLDEVINLLGELVIASAGASMLARQSRQSSLVEANQHIAALVEEIRNGTLQLRMVPIGETFARFRRVVRDTAAELGKDVHLELVGGDTELDKSVVEHIADPLMHLVRNALDHGLESAEQRLAAGKPAQGRLTLSACHESGSILIRIIDDGRGIDRERVLARAWERGLVEHGVVPTDADILNLIFEAGFSTAQTVTNLSGRGVGMDVVRRNIQALRGSVHIDSEPGQGSRIEIRLPLTLAIIDGFLVGVGSSKFIFPLDAVVEVIENRPTTTAFDARGRSTIELRGQMLPVVNLRTLYALDTPEPARGSVVVLRGGSGRYGVLVDQLLGQHQTVIKPLGRMFSSLRGMSGSSILGNGEVALIFDVPALCQLAERPRRHPSPSTPESRTHRASPSPVTEGTSS